jgi:hypothetical protein
MNYIIRDRASTDEFYLEYMLSTPTDAELQEI